MKAYQVTEFGAPIQPRELPDPNPTGREVLIDVVSCGLCHSDVHYHKGHLGVGGGASIPVSALGIELPATLGHEISGKIAAFGPDSGLTKQDLGRPVIVYPWTGCGHCEACLAERDNECLTPRSIGVQLPGGHGEKVIVREAKYLVDADGIEANVAGIYACSGLTAYAALSKLQRRDGWVAIIGMGGVGLMALSIAKGTGFGKVAAIDIDQEKLARARNDFGADLAFNSRSEGVAESLKQQTGGFIGIIDLVGSDQTIGLALSVLRNGGTYVGVGLFGGALNVPLAILNSRQISIKGSYVGTLRELRELIHHVQQGTIKQIPILNAPISMINEGLKALSAGKIDGRIVHLHAAPDHAD
jgi:D-arabinose 1-dehydrogenase-like Zn-dependent alcohol dehydrogenase